MKVGAFLLPVPYLGYYENMMQSARVVNWAVLCSVTFVVSWTLGLVWNRDKALLTGAIAIPASYIGAVVAQKRRMNQEKRFRGSLRYEIQALEEEEIRLLESLSAVTVKRQGVEANLNALQAERSQLRNRVSELYDQRSKIYQELTYLQEQKQQQEEDFYYLQTQVQQFEEQQFGLSQSLSTKIAQIKQTETRSKRLLEEQEQLQNQISEKQQQQEQLHQELIALELHKQHLGGETYDLQTQIQVLEQHQQELDQALLDLQLQKQQSEANLTLEATQFQQLQIQVQQEQQQQQKLRQELATLEKGKQQLELYFRHLQTQIQTLEKEKIAINQNANKQFEETTSVGLPEERREWLKFTLSLNHEQKIVLKAILEQDEATLKKIADKNSTMPQVLIDAINHQALETLGDTIFISSNAKSAIPKIHQEYYPILVEPIEIYLKDLLTIVG